MSSNRKATPLRPAAEARTFRAELTESEVLVLMRHHTNVIRRVTKQLGTEAMKVRAANPLRNCSRELGMLLAEAERLGKLHAARAHEFESLLKS